MFMYSVQVDLCWFEVDFIFKNSWNQVLRTVHKAIIYYVGLVSAHYIRRPGPCENGHSERCEEMYKWD